MATDIYTKDEVISYVKEENVKFIRLPSVTPPVLNNNLYEADDTLFSTSVSFPQRFRKLKMWQNRAVGYALFSRTAC